MVTTTPKYGWPIPEMSDEPDGVEQLTDLGLAIETDVGNPTIQTWTPTWTSSGSPKPANPATLSGKYSLEQGWCNIAIFMAMGGTSTGGAGQWQFILPFKGHPALAEQIINGKLWEPQYGNWEVEGLIFGNTDMIWCYVNYDASSANFDALQYRNATSTANTHHPRTSNPLQTGGNVVLTGRYLVA